MKYIAKNDDVRMSKQKVCPSVLSMDYQRQQRGLSLCFCALLLNLHETSLMNLEAGLLLPSDDAVHRMSLLGFSLNTEDLEANEKSISILDRAVYDLLATASAGELHRINANVTFYLSANYYLGSVVRRDLLLIKLLQIHQISTSAHRRQRRSIN